jgi:hypothetical protein
MGAEVPGLDGARVRREREQQRSARRELTAAIVARDAAERAAEGGLPENEQRGDDWAHERRRTEPDERNDRERPPRGEDAVEQAVRPLEDEVVGERLRRRRHRHPEMAVRHRARLEEVHAPIDGDRHVAQADAEKPERDPRRRQRARTIEHATGRTKQHAFEERGARPQGERRSQHRKGARDHGRPAATPGRG